MIIEIQNLFANHVIKVMYHTIKLVSERVPKHPLFAGGAGVVNGVPVAEFCNAFVQGESMNEQCV